MLHTVSSPFDRIAGDYDRLWSEAPSGTRQRRAVWNVLEPHFRYRKFVLDLGCGTGVDALHLRSLGVRAFCIDRSTAMVERARSNGLDAEQLDIGDLHRLDRTFDGALSNFGALNCVPHLQKVARELARIVRPGSPVALCLLGRVCLWETAWFLSHGKIRKAVRRWRGRATSSFGEIVYPSHSSVLSAFQSGFRLLQWQGIGLCIPPSYIRLPDWAMERLSGFDGALSCGPALRALADHRLYVFERL